MDKNKYTEVDLGDRFRDLRKEAKLTQEELANMLGITRSAVNGWELGQAIPSVQYLIQLSNIYSVTVDYLLGLGKKDAKDIIDISVLNAKDKSLMRDMARRLKENEMQESQAFASKFIKLRHEENLRRNKKSK